VCVFFFLALIVPHANSIFAMQHYTVICGLSGSKLFSHIISETLQFSEESY